MSEELVKALCVQAGASTTSGFPDCYLVCSVGTTHGWTTSSSRQYACKEAPCMETTQMQN